MVEDIVKKMSALSVGVTTRQASRLAEKAKQEAEIEQGHARKRAHTRHNNYIEDDLNDAVEEQTTVNRVSTGKGTVAIGLGSPGNMCFANAILQTLSASPTLVSWGEKMLKMNIQKWSKDEDAVLGINVLTDIERIIQLSPLKGAKKVSTRNSQKQTLDGNDMVSCKTCKRKTKTFEQSRIISAANLLIVHLNLTTMNRKRTCKLRRTVSVPTIHPLKLYSRATKRFKKVDYELNAVAMHRASMHSGHYTCYFRNQEDHWYLCNYDRVSQVQEEELQFVQSKTTSTSNPYVLFFSKA